MAMFHEAVRGVIEQGKYAARAGWAAGTFLWYDTANKRISQYSGGGGTWNAPTRTGGANAAYTLTMTDIVAAGDGSPIVDWSFVG